MYVHERKLHINRISCLKHKIHTPIFLNERGIVYDFDHKLIIRSIFEELREQYLIKKNDILTI